MKENKPLVRCACDLGKQGGCVRLFWCIMNEYFVYDGFYFLPYMMIMSIIGRNSTEPQRMFYSN